MGQYNDVDCSVQVCVMVRIISAFPHLDKQQIIWKIFKPFKDVYMKQNSESKYWRKNWKGKKFKWKSLEVDKKTDSLPAGKEPMEKGLPTMYNIGKKTHSKYQNEQSDIHYPRAVSHANLTQVQYWISVRKSLKWYREKSPWKHQVP